MGQAEQPHSLLGWEQRSEIGWWDLVGLGLPSQFAALAADMSRCAGRRLRAYVLPTLETGVAGLAVPFGDEDAIVFDASLLDHPGELRKVLAHELAYMLYPGWSDLPMNEDGQIQAFASALGPIILDELPTKIAEVDPMLELILCNQLAA